MELSTVNFFFVDWHRYASVVHIRLSIYDDEQLVTIEIDASNGWMVDRLSSSLKTWRTRGCLRQNNWGDEITGRRLLEEHQSTTAKFEISETVEIEGRWTCIVGGNNYQLKNRIMQKYDRGIADTHHENVSTKISKIEGQGSNRRKLLEGM